MENNLDCVHMRADARIEDARKSQPRPPPTPINSVGSLPLFSTSIHRGGVADVLLSDSSTSVSTADEETLIAEGSVVSPFVKRCICNS